MGRRRRRLRLKASRTASCGSAARIRWRWRIPRSRSPWPIRWISKPSRRFAPSPVSRSRSRWRPSRKFSTPSTRTTATPAAKSLTGAEGDDGTGLGRSRTPARHGQRSAGHPPGERHDRRCARKARQRYPHRAVRERISRPLPRGWRALQSGTAAARVEGRHHFAPEADGQAEHRRAAPAAGWPHQDQSPGPRSGSCAFPRCPRFTAKAW